MSPLRLATSLLLGSILITSAADPTPAKLDKIPDDRLIGDFRRSKSPAVRAHLFGRIIDEMAGGAREVEAPLKKMIADADSAYFKALKTELPAAYRKHLATLSDEQIYEVQWVRRKWSSYVKNVGNRANFENGFLKPALAAADTVLPPLGSVLVGATADRRSELLEYSGYMETCQQEIGFGDGPDPTAGKKSPTGHPYPKLDRPMTARDNLEYLEKSLVMALTIAPPGAANLLATNARVARELDYNENEFVMKAQIVRMIVGSIGWYADPLTCACSRDHSNDRKKGLASGHSSTVPGKKGMGDRSKYWGTSARSEGAGGGKSGWGFLYGLSYGGGHTGPLYAVARNVVGVGMRGGAGTAMYRTDKKWIHPCAAQLNELFMPPGLTRADCKTSNLRTLYGRIQGGDFATAHKVAEKAQEKDPVDAMVLRFFKAAIKVEFDWYMKGAEAIAKTGDYYISNRLAEEGSRKFRGVPEMEEKIRARGGGTHESDNGRKFYAIVGETGRNADVDRLKSFAKRNPTSVYAKAALHCINDGKAPRGAISYFLDQNKEIMNYGYPKW